MTAEGDSVESLRARLQRERAARLQAEEIAERTLTDLYAQASTLRVVARVAEAANQSRDLAEVLARTLGVVQEAAPFEAIQFYEPARDDASVMVLSDDGPASEGSRFVVALRAASAGRRFPGGADLPGAVVEEAGPVWGIPRGVGVSGERAEVLGEGTVFGFPVGAAGTVKGVVEFASPRHIDRVPALLDVAPVVGALISQVLDRLAHLQQMASRTVELEEAVAERTQDLLVARNRTEALLRARTALFNAISHDLSTPLHAALASLAEDPPDTAASTSHLFVLRDRIGDLTGIGMDEVGEARLPRVRSLGEVLAEPLRVHSQLFSSRGGELAWSMAGHEGDSVLIDEAAMQGTLDAALAAIRIAQPTTRLSVSARLVGSQCTVSIRNAAPMPDGEAFVLAEQLASDGGGQFAVVGPHDCESSFPVSRPDRVRKGRSNRVLLVDDTLVTQHLGARMLSGAGHQTDVAADGEQAIEAVRAGSYGIVFMDVMMPGMDGLAATREIRAGAAGEQMREIPIVGLSANSAPGSAERALLAGMDGYITKPFTKAQLLAAAAKHLPAATPRQ